MNKPLYTPAPWTFEPEPNGLTHGIWHDDDTRVAEVETEADARLIAAAPDLLEALRYLVGADNDIQANRGGKSDQAMNRLAALDMAARAIAKATGGA